MKVKEINMFVRTCLLYKNVLLMYLDHFSIFLYFLNLHEEITINFIALKIKQNIVKTTLVKGVKPEITNFNLKVQITKSVRV